MNRFSMMWPRPIAFNLRIDWRVYDEFVDRRARNGLTECISNSTMCIVENREVHKAPFPNTITATEPN